LNSATKPAAVKAAAPKEESPDTGGSRKAAPASKKSDPAPVVAAATPTPAPDPPPVLKTPERPAEESRQPEQPAPPPAAEVFALPQPVTPPSPPAATTTQENAQPPVDPGTLVFQLTLNTPNAAKALPPVKGAENKAETPVLNIPDEPSTPSQEKAGGSSSQAKDQDQREQQTPPPPQPLPAGSDSTIASQFGFQPPLSFTAHTAAKVEAPAPTRAVENVSTPDLPVSQTVDRISLTIRGADDQVVRVAINQTGEMVQVGVNTANADLASQLRISVPELVHKLDQQGYDSKVNFPTFPSSSVPISIASGHSEFRSGADTSGNNKSNNSDITTRDEPKQQRQRSPQKAWRELASQLQDE
jgi:hypothetical protein